ncbi:MAG: hypothetical protein ACI8XM_001593 [Haloarculaceae archaeon]
MTGRHVGESSETDGDAGHDHTESATHLRNLLASDRSVVVGAGLVALLAVAVDASIRLLSNLPFDPVDISPSLRSTVVAGAPLAVGAALLAVALTDDRPTVRVGLLFASVFGSLGTIVPAAVVPATVAVAGGAGLALLGTLGVPETATYRAVRRRALAVGFVTAIAVSLADGIGLLRGAHGIGAVLTLASLTAVGTRAERSVVAVGTGLLAALAVVYVSGASPYVVGSALLVVFAISGVPHVLVAVAVAGGVAATIAGLLERSYPLAIGAALLVLAGIPVALPRAMTVLLGSTLVLLERGSSAEVSL